MQIFARFETHGATRSYADFGSSAGVATYSGFAGAYVEDAEATQLDSISPGESALETFEDSFDGRLCFYAGQSGTLNYLMYDVLLNQWLPPETRTRDAASPVLRRC